MVVLSNDGVTATIAMTAKKNNQSQSKSVNVRAYYFLSFIVPNQALRSDQQTVGNIGAILSIKHKVGPRNVRILVTNAGRWSVWKC